MKVFVFLSLALAAATATDTDLLKEFEEKNVGSIIDNIINDTLCKMIAKFPNPLEIPTLDLNLTESALFGTVSLKNAKIAGLPHLFVSKLHTTLTNLNLTLTLDELSIAFKYALDILIAELVPFYGSGLNNMEFDGISLDLSSAFSLSGSKFSISNVTVTIGLKSSIFNLNGLLDDPELNALLNTALNDNFALFINDHSKVITYVISKIINAILASSNELNAIATKYGALYNNYYV